MDQDVVRFREQALRENHRRRGIRRRYSETLPHQAVSYLAKRQRMGVSLTRVAEALGSRRGVCTDGQPGLVCEVAFGKSPTNQHARTASLHMVRRLWIRHSLRCQCHPQALALQQLL
jgi:hypothetical protein